MAQTGWLGQLKSGELVPRSLSLTQFTRPQRLVPTNKMWTPAMNTDPKTDPRVTAGKAKSMRAGTAEAHDRESRVEAATKRQEEQKLVQEMPSDDGDGGTWQPQDDKA
jgi:hypothetical protein